MATGATFRVGVTRDIRLDDGSAMHDFTLLDGLGWEFLADDSDEIRPEHAERCDALLVFSPRVSAETVRRAERLVLVARLGVGYDRVDVEACTKAGVLLTITPDGIRRPMASGAMALLLALAHRVMERDRQVREGGWNRFATAGLGLAGRTLGIVGLGNVGRDLARLAQPFELRIVAADPYADADSVPLVDLATLLREADFVCITCPLTEETRHLIDARALALMKPTAFIVNIARGPIVDQRALTEALRERRIAGAALDVFEREPLDPDDPLLELDNVLLAPHAIGLTDELFRESGRSACRAVLDVAAGRVPAYLVNPEALDHPSLQRRLTRG